MHTRLFAEHDHMRALLDELDTYLDRDCAPDDARFAALRWTLLRDYLRHSRSERAFVARLYSGSAHARAHGTMLTAIDGGMERHAREWTGATIAAGWQRYRAAARALATLLRQQMDEEDRVFWTPMAGPPRQSSAAA